MASDPVKPADSVAAAKLVEHALTHLAKEEKAGATTVSIENVRKWLDVNEFLKSHPVDHHPAVSAKPDANELIEKIRDVLGVGQNQTSATVTIKGVTHDLASTPVDIDIMGVNIRIGPSGKGAALASKEPEPQVPKYDIRIEGPDRGDLGTGTPPGKLFINDIEIAYEYRPSNGIISSHAMFSVHRTLTDFAKAYISAIPTLKPSGHHH